MLKGDALFFAVAHESMHAAQFCNGQGGTTIFNEIEAYVFGYSVNQQYMFSQGKYAQIVTENGSAIGRLYSYVMQKLLYNGYDFIFMNLAVFTFKNGSSANINGLYNNYRLYGGNPFRLNSMIQKYFEIK